MTSLFQQPYTIYTLYLVACLSALLHHKKNTSRIVCSISMSIYRLL